MPAGSSHVDIGVICSGDTRAYKMQPSTAADGEKSVDSHSLGACLQRHDCENFSHWRYLKDILVLPMWSVDRPWGPGILETVQTVFQVKRA